MSESSRSNRGGRYNRAEGTQYHNRLAQISEKEGEKDRNEKVVKLTELLRKREIISERNRATKVESDRNNQQANEADFDTEVGNKNDMVGNFCTEDKKQNATNGDRATREIVSTQVPQDTVPNTDRTRRQEDNGNIAPKTISDVKETLLRQTKLSNTTEKSNSSVTCKDVFLQEKTTGMIWEYESDNENTNVEHTQKISQVKIKEECIQLAIEGNSTPKPAIVTMREEGIPSEADKMNNVYNLRVQSTYYDDHHNALVWPKKTAGVSEQDLDETYGFLADRTTQSEEDSKRPQRQADIVQVERRQNEHTDNIRSKASNYARTNTQNKPTKEDNTRKQNTTTSSDDITSQLERDNMIWEYAEKEHVPNEKSSIDGGKKNNTNTNDDYSTDETSMSHKRDFNTNNQLPLGTETQEVDAETSGSVRKTR